MIDTNNVVQFQHRNDLHRHFAPGVIEGHKAPMTTLEKVLVVLIYAASVFFVAPADQREDDEDGGGVDQHHEHLFERGHRGFVAFNDARCKVPVQIVAVLELHDVVCVDHGESFGCDEAHAGRALMSFSSSATPASFR